MAAIIERPLPPILLEYAAGTGVHRFEWWCGENFRHSKGPLAGRPLELEDHQWEWFAEVYAVDEDGSPYWKTCVKIEPRKNGKSTETSAAGGYEADESDETPIVGVAATSDDQAKEVFDVIAASVLASPVLSERFHVRDYDGEIARTDGAGFIRRIRMDWRRLHGKNLSKLIADEIHAWSTPNLRKCWEALTTGEGARPDFQALCITTEGEPDPAGMSILGQIVHDNELYGDVEERPGLTISRNHDARVLVYRYHAPMPDADPDPVREAYRRWAQAKRDEAPDAEVAELRAAYEAASDRCVAALKLANPASWVSKGYLARKVIDPKLSRAALLRYHGCVAADEEDVFIPTDVWAGLVDADAGRIAPGARVGLGFDGSRSYDTTAAAWATRLDDGRIAVRTHVWSTRQDVQHHALCDGKIDYAAVKAFVIDDLLGQFDVADAAYDPRYLVDTMEAVRDALPEARIAEVEPQSKLMRDAIACFFELVDRGALVTDGDPVLAAHVAAAKGSFDADRGWTVRKRDQKKPIDALIAAILAVWRCSLAAGDGEPWFEVWE